MLWRGTISWPLDVLFVCRGLCLPLFFDSTQEHCLQRGRTQTNETINGESLIENVSWMLRILMQSIRQTWLNWQKSKRWHDPLGFIPACEWKQASQSAFVVLGRLLFICNLLPALTWGEWDGYFNSCLMPRNHLISETSGSFTLKSEILGLRTENLRPWNYLECGIQTERECGVHFQNAWTFCITFP